MSQRAACLIVDNTDEANANEHLFLRQAHSYLHDSATCRSADRTCHLNPAYLGETSEVSGLAERSNARSHPKIAFLNQHPVCNCYCHDCIYSHENNSFAHPRHPYYRTRVVPSGDCESPVYANIDAQNSAASVDKSANNDSLNTVWLENSNVSVNSTSTHQPCLCQPIPTSLKLQRASNLECAMTNNNSAKRPSSHIQPYLHVKLEAQDDGLLGKFARKCQLTQCANKQLSQRIRATSLPPSMTGMVSSGSTVSPYELSTVTSMSSLPNTSDFNTIHTSVTNKGVQLLSQMSFEMQKTHLVSSHRDNICEQDTIAIEYHPVLHISPPQKVAESFSVTPERAPVEAEVPIPCESKTREKNTEINTATLPLGQGDFRTQTNNLITRARSKNTIRLLQRNTTPKLITNKSSSKAVVSMAASAIPPQRGHYQITQDNSSSSVCMDRSFVPRRFVKKRFYLPESANLEEILADADDRRIMAICNKFHCEMVAFAKLPRKGSMQHTIILTGSCREDIIKCARCLDARLGWCLSAQLE